MMTLPQMAPRSIDTVNLTVAVVTFKACKQFQNGSTASYVHCCSLNTVMAVIIRTSHRSITVLGKHARCLKSAIALQAHPTPHQSKATSPLTLPPLHPLISHNQYFQAACTQAVLHNFTSLHFTSLVGRLLQKRCCSAAKPDVAWIGL